MFKFLVWHVLVVAASCELFAQESGYTVDYARTYHNYQPRDYNFNYAVSDPHTGDHKSQWEVKEKGVVRGGYSLLEPDGTTRIVEYIADDDGFRAIVKKLGTAVQPVAVHPQVPVVPEVVPQLSRYSAYDGQVTNYANIQVPPVLYRIEQNLGHQEAVLEQPQALGTIEGNVGAVPLLQGYGGLNRVVQGQSVGGAEANLARAEAVPLPQGQGIGGIETVPSIQGHSIDFSRFDGLTGIQANLGRDSAVPLPQGHGIERIETVPSIQGHSIDFSRFDGLTGIQANLGRDSAVPLPQGHGIERIETVPSIQGHSIDFSRIAEIQGNLGRFSEVPLQGYNIGDSGRPEAVPLQGHNLQGADFSILQGNIDAGLGRVEAVPVQGQNVENIGAIPVQGQSVGRIETGPFQGAELERRVDLSGNINARLGNIKAVPIQGQNLGRFEPVPFQGYELGNADLSVFRDNIDINLGRVDPGPVQGQNLEGVGAVPIQGQGWGRFEEVPASQGQIHAARPEVPLDNNIDQGRAVPGLVPISPSYTTNIQYYGLTGNPNDDSQYRKDAKREVYHASYSQKVPKMVPVPNKRSKLPKKEFIIYYPDSESN